MEGLFGMLHHYCWKTTSIGIEYRGSILLQNPFYGRWDMNKSVCKYIVGSVIFLQMGCSNREVLLESEFIKQIRSSGVLGLLSSVSSDVIEDFEMTIDVGMQTATPFSNQTTAIPLDLIEMDTEDWQGLSHATITVCQSNL